MSKIINKLSQIFRRSYGVDELYKFLLLVCLILLIINIFVNNIYVRLLEIVIFTYAIYRVLSSNRRLRIQENNIYLKWKGKVEDYFKYLKRVYRDRNDHMYRKCPNCKKHLRLPLKKGKHMVKCPACGHEFEVHCFRNEKIKVEIVK